MGFERKRTKVNTSGPAGATEKVAALLGRGHGRGRAAVW